MQILAWWFSNKTGHHHSNTGSDFRGNRGGGLGSGASTSCTMAAHAAAGLCDEVVALWRLAALNPALGTEQRRGLSAQLTHWQMQCLDRLRKAHVINNHPTDSNSSACRLEWESTFFGFNPAIEACQLDWSDVALPPGVSELVRSRGPSHSARIVRDLGPWSSAAPTLPEFAVADGDSDGARLCGAVRLKEPWQKVPMRSEHSTVHPCGCVSSLRSDRDCSTLSYDLDAAVWTEKPAASSGSGDEQLCCKLSKLLTTGNSRSSETSNAENRSDVSVRVD